ncbi:GNAT family protein [Micromonospora sp. NPDC023956]|uniref:GNAT family N-acetyltransferase n=1 Tax=Micromonospora sp. NPDC023956 TaxID=3155722 RepID=UPI0033E63E51
MQIDPASAAPERRPDFAAKPTLTGERVLLRPFLDDDLPALRTALADPEVVRLTGSTGVAHDEEGLRRWYAGRNAQTDRLDLAVVDRATGACVGEVVLNQWDAHNRSCNFRTLIGPAGRDRGLGTEAVRLVVGHGFERLGLHRISLEVYHLNPRARRVYEKVGFVAEGVLRDALRDGDHWVDATVMSILAPEWTVHRGHPERIGR